MDKLKEKNSYLSTLHIVFEMSAAWAMLRIIITGIEALVSSSLLALTVANFVNKVLFVIENTGDKKEVYLALGILLLIFGVFINIGSVIKLVDIRLRININRKISPILVKTQAGFEYKHIENDTSWEIISRVMRDPAASLVDGFSAYATIIQIIISIVSVLGLLWMHVWWSVIVILIFSVPLFWISLRAGKKNYRAGQAAERFNRRTEYLDTVLAGRDSLEERTLFGFGEVISHRWKEQYEEGRKLQLNVSVRQFVAMKGASMVLALISLLIAATLLFPVVNGQLSVGLFIGIVSSIFGIINKLASQMSNSMEKISRNREYMKDMHTFLNLSSEQGALSSPKANPMDFETLEFRNVSFKYPTGDNMILKDMSFVLEKGKHYAFVGKNGAGKSTITKLLTGLYTDYTGTILINGRDIKSYDMDEIKALFSVVYQDFARYSISLRDNIVLGNMTEMDEGDVDACVIHAGLSDLVSGLNYGINTKLGKIYEDGQELSSGQWQKVAIARALMSHAPVRILDEPTAALDPISESRIYQEFKSLLIDKTTIFISHRLGSTKLSNEILVVDDGRIAERGKHEELMTLNGIYAEMFESQRSWY